MSAAFVLVPVASLAVAAATPQPNAWLGTLPAWISAMAAIAAFTLAGITAHWAAQQWRLQHFTAEWGKTVQFLIANPDYINRARNLKYRESFQGNEADKYELVARLSIAYVDDLYHLKMGKHLDSWMKGSVQLFVKPHEAYFRDHTDAYSAEFVREMDKLLRSV